MTPIRSALHFILHIRLYTTATLLALHLVATHLLKTSTMLSEPRHSIFTKIAVLSASLYRFVVA